jgi:hypothetical protein
MAAEAAKGAGRTARGREWFGKRAFSVRGEQRHVITALVIVCLGLTLLLLATNFIWASAVVSASNKPGPVFHEKCGVTTAHTSDEYTTGPSEPEIDRRAFDLIRLYLEAGSTDFQSRFNEAREFMSDEMKATFDQAAAVRAAELTRLKVYGRLEGTKVRPLTQEDLPAGVEVNITRYDVVVEGRLDLYREGEENPKPISSRDFAYYVNFKPLEQRTNDNPYMLVYTGMVEIPPRKPKADGEGAAAEAQRVINGTKAEDAQTEKTDKPEEPQKK